MKSLAAILMVCLMLCCACQGEDLKKQLEEKKQIVAAQTDELKKLKDDMASREAELKTQCEQRLQKATVQSKQQIEALNARVVDLLKRRDAEKSPKQPEPKPAHKPKT